MLLRLVGADETYHHRPVLIGPSPCRYSSCTTLTPESLAAVAGVVVW